MVLRPHLYCLPSRFTVVRYLYWFLGLCGIWSGVFCSVCAACANDSSAGSCVCLAQGYWCGGFFPSSAVFALVLGTSVLAYGILALPLLFLGYAYGVAFFGSVCLSSACLYPAVAGLVGFSCGPHLWWSLCVCGDFLRWRRCVFFLSSCSVWGRLLLRLFWCYFCASSCGADGFPRLVLPQVTLRGFRNLSGSSCLSCSCGGALLWGLQCFWCAAWFSTLCRALPPGPAVCAAYPAAGYPWGVFCLFCHRVPDLLLLWWRRLGGNPSLILSVLLLHRLACRGLLGSAPCVRELPLGLSALWVTV